jgi:RNA polymerase sigma-70 factor (ECF subfamily)
LDLPILLLLAATLPDEPELARRLRRQDPRALTILYDSYGRIVYRLVFQIVRDAAACEDIVQETFTRVWSRAHLIDENAAQVGPWILTIARNKALDYLRSSTSRTSVQEAFVMLEDHVLSFANAEETIITEENARLVAKALQSLSSNQRQVIELAYYRGLSQSQIAQELNQPLGTVKSWIRTALLQLRSVLQSQRRNVRHA